jgi:hypothetical protein
MMPTLLYELVCQVDDEAGVPTPIEVAASLRALNRYIDTNTSSIHRGLAEPMGSRSAFGTRSAPSVAGNRKSFSGRTLRRIVSAMFDGLAIRTVAALFGLKDTTLTALEVERLKKLVEQAETQDK